MSYLIRFALLVCLTLAGLVPVTVSAHTPRPVYWYSCRYAPSTHRSCHEYVVRHAPHAPLSYSKRCTRSGHVVTCVRFPVFVQPQPAGYWATYEITGYAVCDTPGAFMADGTPVNSPAGQYGAAATYPGYPGGLAFGTRVLIPSLQRIVTIHDRGSYAYFTVPHLDVYFGSDCSIGNNLGGRGTHWERIFVYLP